MRITKATQEDCDAIVQIGMLSVAESHKGSSSDKEMNEYLEQNYNIAVISRELQDLNNFYYIIHCDDKPVGFSKIVLNAEHPIIASRSVAKLDRIYLLKDYYGLKLGLELLNFNIDLAKNNFQSGIWLYAWIGNERAINFYIKSGFKIIGDHKFYINDTHYDLSHHMFLPFTSICLSV